VQTVHWIKCELLSCGRYRDVPEEIIARFQDEEDEGEDESEENEEESEREENEEEEKKSKSFHCDLLKGHSHTTPCDYCLDKGICQSDGPNCDCCPGVLSLACQGSLFEPQMCS
jgi:hypothetical protein